MAVPIRSLVFLGLAVLVVGCDSPTAENGHLEMSLSATPDELTQGQTHVTTVSIVRSGFNGPIALAAVTPAGVTASFEPNELQAGTTSSTLSIVVSRFAVPGAAVITVVAKGGGAAEEQDIAFVVKLKGAYGIDLTDTVVTVAQGGGGSTTLVAVRQNDFSGVISLSVTGAPSGIEARVEEDQMSSDFAVVSLTASVAAATGSYQITAKASSPGLADSTRTFRVNVVAPPPTTSVTVTFCSPPAWVGFRNDGYHWQPATVSGNSVTIPATERLAFAWQRPGRTTVYHLTRAELSAVSFFCGGSKTLYGSVAGLSATQRARVELGLAVASPWPSSSVPNFTLQGAPDTGTDLLSAIGTITGGFIAQKIIVRRGVNLATSSTMPVLDFAAEGFTPTTVTLNVTGFNAMEYTDAASTLYTATNWFNMRSAGLTSPTVSLPSVPVSEMAADDVQELYVEGYQFGNPLLDGRWYTGYFRALEGRTPTLGPPVNVPTVSVIGQSPYRRMRARLTSQAEYPTLAHATFFQGNARAVQLTLTAGYLGGTPAVWDIAIPWFGDVEGLNEGWLLESTDEYYVDSQGGPVARMFGAYPSDGDVITGAYRHGALSLVTSLVSARRDSVRPAPRIRGRNWLTDIPRASR